MTMEKRTNKKMPVLMLALSGMIIAVLFILERILVIDVNPSLRLSFSFIGHAVCGTCLGPIYGFVTSVIADILGCFYKGFEINPIITLAAGFRGVMYGVCLFRKQTAIRCLIAAVLDQFVAGLIITTTGLVIYGYMPLEWPSILARLIKCSIFFGIEVIVLISLIDPLLIRPKKLLESFKKPVV